MNQKINAPKPFTEQSRLRFLRESYASKMWLLFTKIKILPISFLGKPIILPVRSKK